MNNASRYWVEVSKAGKWVQCSGWGDRLHDAVHEISAWVLYRREGGRARVMDVDRNKVVMVVEWEDRRD